MKEIRLGPYMVRVEEDGLFSRFGTNVDFEIIEKEFNVDTSFFRTLPKVKRDYDGIELYVPIYYYRNSAIQGIFTADYKGLKDLLPPDTGLEPVEIFPGRGLIVFTAFNYQLTDIDPYNEFAIMVMVHKPGEKRWGPLEVIHSQLSRFAYAFVWQLPVTTPLADLLGRISYSFPKYVTDIPFFESKDWISASIMRDGEAEVTLHVKKKMTKRQKIIDAHVFLYHEGKIAEVVSRVNPIKMHTGFSPFGAKIELGNGPIADRLRSLKIGRAIRYDYMPDIQIMLIPGDMA